MEGRTRYIVIALVSVAVILAVIFLIRGIFSIVNRTPQRDNVTQAAKEITKINVDPGKITKDPLVYDGLTVEMDANISDWVTKKVFAVSASNAGAGFFGGSAGQLVIVSKSEFPLHTTSVETGLGLGETVRVHIKGRVRIVDATEFERATGIDLDGDDIKLDDNRISNWQEAPIILLESVEKL